MADGAQLVLLAFERELWNQLERRGESVAGEIHGMSSHEAEELGRRAALTVVAPAIWRSKVGEVLETGDVLALLGISRQALNKRVQSGSVLGLAGRGTTYFPKWQFELDEGRIRPFMPRLVSLFRNADPRMDSLIIASWARTPQSSLDGLTVEQWIEKDSSEEPILQAAEEAVGALLQ